MSKAAATRRLRALEEVRHRRQGESIPPEQRWWCNGLPEGERQECLSEHVTWADAEADWWLSAEAALPPAASAGQSGEQ